ncbi:MAG: toprim domain-containing protein, partial [Thermoleophilaceae bacterium]|nr:toprim domain-containing protein [Thermoleophilaceae bacterium]
YKKGRQLFGIDQARAPAARAGRVVVVEGYTDVLALHQAGVKETVAIMGTALTEDQLKELTRAVGKGGRIYLALDADRSGLEAMQRAADMSPDLELRVVPLTEGTDPADLLAAEGPEGFTKLLESALSIPEFRVRRLVAGVNPSDAPAVDAALFGARELIGHLPSNSATRVALVSFVADQLGVPPHLVTTQAPVRTSSARTRTVEPSFDSGDHERAFLASCLAQPRIGKPYLEELKAEHFTSIALFDAGRWLLTHFDTPLSGIPTDQPELVAEVGRIVTLAEQRDFSEGDVKQFFLSLEQRKTQHLLRLAERQGDFHDAERLQMKLQEIRKKATEELA